MSYIVICCCFFYFTGLQDDDLTKLEMVTLLCMGDKTHSQLMDLMPEKCGIILQNKNFEATLARVSFLSL